MNPPSSHFDLRFEVISSLEELAKITYGVIAALEEVFCLKRNWFQAAPEGIQPDAEGLSPLHLHSKIDLTYYLKDRGWADRFSKPPTERTGMFFNETIITQVSPKEFSISFEHIDPDKPGGWRILVVARGHKIDRKLFLSCAKLIHKQNEMRDGLIRCSYKSSQEQIGKYMPVPLTEDVYIYNLGRKHI
jgi:hypothetical protein